MRARVRIWQAGLLLFLLLGWEITVRIGWVDAFFFSKPSDIALRIVEWFRTGEIYTHLWVTLLETLLAFVIGTVLGVVMGLWLALMPTASAVLDPFIKAMNSIPRVILAPIFTLWFGLGMASKVALGVTLVFFVAFFNTYQGIKEVNPVVLANARMLGASGSQLLKHVYLPSAASSPSKRRAPSPFRIPMTSGCKMNRGASPKRHRRSACPADTPGSTIAQNHANGAKRASDRAHQHHPAVWRLRGGEGRQPDRGFR